VRTFARPFVVALFVALAGPLLQPWTQPVLGLTLVAVPDTLTMVHDRTAVVPPRGVLANDVGLLGSSTAVLDGPPPSHGSVTLRPDGGYTYSPVAGYVGTDVFHYHAHDVVLLLPVNSTSTTVTITITNATPVARNDAYTTTVAGTRTVGAPGVMANDSDVDGDPIQASLVTGAAHGTVSLAADGSFGYASVAGYSGADSFTYRVSDGLALSSTASVTLTVPAPPPTPTPTPPPPTPTPPPPTPTPTPTPKPTPAPTPTPTPTLPLPTLPLPTLPLPTLPLPTIRPTLRPSLPPTLPPLPTPSLGQPTPPVSSRAPDASGAPVAAGPVASPGSSGPPTGGTARDPFAVGGKAGPPLDGLVNIEVPTIGGIEWAVPALVLTAPGLLLILAIAIQAVVGAVWLPFVRRWLGFGLLRRRREARASR
jgi:hypothetical protein